MSCQEIENRILDYQESQLSPAQREEVDAHLAGCAGCRMFARQLQQLDVALSAHVKAPALSAGFDQRLAERIQASPAVLSEAQRAERKRQLQAEFETGMARIAWGSFAFGSLRKHLTWPVLTVLAGWLVWRLTPLLTTHFNAKMFDGIDPGWLPWLAASTVFVMVGMAEAFPRPWKSIGLW